MSKIILGMEVIDTVTEISGTATAFKEFYGGHRMYMLERVTEQNEILEYWFDEYRLEELK